MKYPFLYVVATLVPLWLSAGTALAAPLAGPHLPGPSPMPGIVWAGPDAALSLPGAPSLLRAVGFDGVALGVPLEGPPADGEDKAEDRSVGPTVVPLTPAQELFRSVYSGLADQGLRQNLIQYHLEPVNYFADREAQRALLQSATALGRVSRQMAVPGVALMLPRYSFMFDPRWDGYELSTTSAVALQGAARDLGRRFVQAILREHTDARIYVVTGAPDESGTLWFDWIGGMLSGLEAIAEQRLHLLFWTPPLSEDMLSHRHTLYRYLDRHLSERVGADWRSRASLNVALTPDGRRGDGLQQALIEALLFSEEAVWLDTGEIAGWPLAADAADEALPRTLRFPFRAYRRIGLVQGEGLLAWRLMRDGQQALLPWGGVGAGVTLPAQLSPMEYQALTGSGGPVLLASEGERTLPMSSGPVLVSGIAPDGLGLDGALFAYAPTGYLGGGVGREALNIVLVNPWRERITGTMVLGLPPQLSLGSESMAFSLEGGEGKGWQRFLQGRMDAGRAVPLEVTVALEGRAPIVVEMEVPVAPAVAWTATTGGDVVGIAPWPGDTALPGRYVVVSEGGDVGWIDRAGRHRHRQFVQTRFVTQPVVYTDAAQRRWVVAGDHRGRTWWIDGEGGGLRDYITRAFSEANPIRVWTDGEGQEHLWVCSAAGWIHDFDGPARLLWEQRYDGAVRVAALVPGADKHGLPGMAIVLSGARPMAILLDGQGNEVWYHPLEGQPVGTPVISTPDIRGVRTLTVVQDTGIARVMDLANGARLRDLRLPALAGLRGVVWAGQAAREGPTWVAWGEEAVLGLNLEFQAMWRLPQTGVEAVHIAPRPFDTCILQGRQHMIGVSPRGAFLWQDDQALGAIGAVYMESGPSNSREFEVLVADGGRGVFGLRIADGR